MERAWDEVLASLPGKTLARAQYGLLQRLLRKAPWGRQAAQTSICSMMKASMTSPTLMSLYFSMVMPHS